MQNGADPCSDFEARCMQSHECMACIDAGINSAGRFAFKGLVQPKTQASQGMWQDVQNALQAAVHQTHAQACCALRSSLPRTARLRMLLMDEGSMQLGFQNHPLSSPTVSNPGLCAQRPDDCSALRRVVRRAMPPGPECQRPGGASRQPRQPRWACRSRCQLQQAARPAALPRLPGPPCEPQRGVQPDLRARAGDLCAGVP
eukprot:360578-Chlamydomonas_euryale.AAC.12